MAKFEYHGDDACPKCGAIYCANSLDYPTDADDKVSCLDCGYHGTIKEFVDAFNKLHPDFADSEVDDG